MRKFSKKQWIVAGVAAGVIAAGTGAAYAYWTTSGTGNGSATTGNSTPFAVTVDPASGPALTPGGPADTVTFHVTNTNSGFQNFANATATVTGTSIPGCTAGNYSTGNLVAAFGDLPPGATANGSFTVQMNDTNVNQNVCQGATVNLQVLASS
jgi:hypothetical protein